MLERRRFMDLEALKEYKKKGTAEVNSNFIKFISEIAEKKELEDSKEEKKELKDSKGEGFLEDLYRGMVNGVKISEIQTLKDCDLKDDKELTNDILNKELKVTDDEDKFLKAKYKQLSFGFVCGIAESINGEFIGGSSKKLSGKNMTDFYRDETGTLCSRMQIANHLINKLTDDIEECFLFPGTISFEVTYKKHIEYKGNLFFSNCLIQLYCTAPKDSLPVPPEDALKLAEMEDEVRTIYEDPILDPENKAMIKAKNALEEIANNIATNLQPSGESKSDISWFKNRINKLQNIKEELIQHQFICTVNKFQACIDKSSENKSEIGKSKELVEALKKMLNEARLIARYKAAPLSLIIKALKDTILQIEKPSILRMYQQIKFAEKLANDKSSYLAKLGELMLHVAQAIAELLSLKCIDIFQYAAKIRKTERLDKSQIEIIDKLNKSMKTSVESEVRADDGKTEQQFVRKHWK